MQKSKKETKLEIRTKAFKKFSSQIFFERNIYAFFATVAENAN